MDNNYNMNIPKNMNRNQKVILTLWLVILVLYGIYLYNTKIAYCWSDWLPTGLNQIETSSLCFNSFLHSFSIFFLIITILAFVLYKIWGRNK